MASTLSQEVIAPYADALVSLGSEQGILPQLGDDIRFVLAALKGTPELQVFLSSPVISADTKKEFLQQVFAPQVNAFVINFLKLLADRRRILFLEAVCLRFLDLQRKLQGIALAEVTSAIELTESQKQALMEKIQRFAQATNVELQTKVDTRLLGGVVVRVGSQVVDLSLRGQLRRLALQLA